MHFNQIFGKSVNFYDKANTHLQMIKDFHI